jgi:hypothetical protein
MIENYKPPYTKSFVVKTTLRHMKKSIDISVSKSLERLKDVDNQSIHGKEVLETLSVLHTMRKLVDEFEAQNQHLF